MKRNIIPVWASISCASVIIAGLAASPPAHADVVLSFAQNINGPTVSGTTNAADTQTTIIGTDIPVTISQFIGGGTPIMSYLIFDLVSSEPVSMVFGQLLEPFSGSFSFTSQIGGGGINYLSSSFTDFVFGINGGSSLTLNASEPPGTVSFTSDVLNVSSLELPRATSLGFADVTPPGSIVGTTLAGFTSSVSGTVSAGVINNVPEPASLTFLGLGIGTIAALKRRRRATKVLTSMSELSAMQAA